MDQEQTRLIARDETRKYFDHFLIEVLPRIIAEQISVSPQIKFITKMKWIMVGVGVTVAILVPTVGFKVLNFL